MMGAARCSMAVEPPERRALPVLRGWETAGFI
jgi:hypothetical protein